MSETSASTPNPADVFLSDKRIERFTKQYGITFNSAVSPENPFDPFEPFGLASEEAKGSGEEEKPFGKPFEREVEPEAKGSKGSKGFKRDTEEKIGMSIDEALRIWTKEGKPVIHLGPGENCFDLEKALNFGRANERHPDAPDFRG